MTEQDAVHALGALAQQSRLQIFRQLVVAGASGMTPGGLSQALGVTPTALSFHLKELTHAHLITQERDGRNLIYRAEFAAMNALLGFLTANCCTGEPCEVTKTSADCSTC